MVFKIVVSDPKSRKAYQKEVEENASGLIGKKVGGKVSGGFLGLEGYELEITGGSDRQGFPIRPDVDGQGRKKIVLAFPPGFHPVRSGERKRKSVRGNTISKDISQINLKILKAGKKPLETVLGVKEKPKEAPKEGEKAEVKPEEKKEEKPEKKEEAPKEGKKEEKPEEKKEVPKEEKAEKPVEEKMGVKTLEEKEKEIAKEEKEKPAEEGKKKPEGKKKRVDS